MNNKIFFVTPHQDICHINGSNENMEGQNTNEIEELLRAILALKNLDEAERFFQDLLTKKELIEFSRRWKAAKMRARKVTYSKIIEETGLSSATLARVSKCLRGVKGGYRLILKRLAIIE